MEDFEELSNKFIDAMKAIEDEQEAYWNSLTKEQQLSAFCAVSRRIHDGEMRDKGSYRHVLYGVFGFGPESYAPAQMAGYLDIHNSIHGPDYDSQLLKAFCIKNDISDYEKKVFDFLI